MSALAPVLLGLFAAAATILLIYWSAVGYHVVRTLHRLPTARHGVDIPLRAPAPRLCVLVPAHNEEGCIAAIAASLASQDYPADGIRFVFILDRCTDRTRAALDRAIAESGGDEAAKARFEIIELDSCPPGWIGKSHALWTGVQRSRGAAGADILLFVDADTVLDPRLVRAATALLDSRGLGLLSLLSTLTYGTWFERIVQPAAGMELMRQYPLVRANDPARRRPFANGQFIMIRRNAYEQIGGHEALKDAVLEDVELARRAEWNRIPIGFFLDGGMLACRMYDSYPALRTGWKRIYGESANRRPGRLRKLALRLRLVSTILPLTGVLALILGLALRGTEHTTLAAITAILAAAGLAVWLAVLLLCYRIGRIPLWAAPAHPVGALFAAGIMLEAAADLEAGRPTVWGGIEFARPGR